MCRELMDRNLHNNKEDLRHPGLRFGLSDNQFSEDSDQSLKRDDQVIFIPWEKGLTNHRDSKTCSDDPMMEKSNLPGLQLSSNFTASYSFRRIFSFISSSLMASLILLIISSMIQSSRSQQTDQVLAASEVTIDCYRCKSQNFSDRSCHDPFGKSSLKLIERCQVPMGSSDVLVPANHCIKINGISGKIFRYILSLFFVALFCIQ